MAGISTTVWGINWGIKKCIKSKSSAEKKRGILSKDLIVLFEALQTLSVTVYLFGSANGEV